LSRKEREITMSAYAQKLESARTIFVEHNAQIEDESKKLDFDIFVSNLKAEGGTSEEGLSECSFEDIAEFGATEGKRFPKLLAKRIAKVFRKKETRPKAITEKKARMMNTRELLEAYNPKEFDAVAERLLELSKLPVGGMDRKDWPNHPCIVIDDDGSINVAASAACIEDLKEGLPPLNVFIGNDGVPQKLYKVGERPDSAVSENPLLPGRVLRGTTEACDKTHRSWSKIPHKVRVLLRLALASGELAIDQVTRIHDTLDLLIGKSEQDMVSVVSQRFHQAALLYKIVRSSTPNAARKQDPFHRHKRF
jgi:hypothetical protein